MKNRIRSIVGSVCLVAGVMAIGSACAHKSATPPPQPTGAETASVAPSSAPATTAGPEPTAEPTAAPPSTNASPTVTTPTPPAPAATQDKPYTKDSPGPWDAATAAKHSPEITFVKAGKGLKVTVKVDSHPMDAQKPHYIMWIKLQDADGKELGKKEFAPTDPAPVASFELATVPPTLSALEQCNIHGIWQNTVPVKLR
jgi:desulfoferrodoxin-like iron-binding protein